MADRVRERQRKVERVGESWREAERGQRVEDRGTERAGKRQRERPRKAERVGESCRDKGTIKGHCRHLQYFCKCFQLM